MLLVILFAFYFGGVQLPLATNVYSPPASFLAPDAMSTGYVEGTILFDEIGTPAAGIIVRLFATDELIDDYATTDASGFFRSNIQFYAGQILKVTVDGWELDRKQVFIPYTLEQGQSFSLGVFYISP